MVVVGRYWRQSLVRATVAGYGEEVFIDESIRGQRRRIKRAAHQNDDRLHCQEALGDREEPRVYEGLCIKV